MSSLIRSVSHRMKVTGVTLTLVFGIAAFALPGTASAYQGSGRTPQGTYWTCYEDGTLPTVGGPPAVVTVCLYSSGLRVVLVTAGGVDVILEHN